MANSLQTRLVLILALLCVFLARVDGAHLHLCFDGGEPASTLHVLHDTGADSHPGADRKHTDEDVSLVGSMLVKNKSSVDIAPALLGALILLVLLSFTSLRLPIPRRVEIFPVSAFGFLPPPRGPPA